jgi:hypothetical protein
LLPVLGSAQGKTGSPKNKVVDLIQFSGVVLTADSLDPISFASVYNRSMKKSTYCDFYGFFSFVAREGDTIQFSSIGFKKVRLILPDSIGDLRQTIVQVMKPDTIFLKEQVIYPWPSREEFANAFVNMKLPTSDIDRMNSNMSLAELKQDNFNFGGDALTGYNNTMAREYNRMLSNGQIPSANLLNPLAWSKFLQAWKRGDFKNKSKD